MSPQGQHEVGMHCLLGQSRSSEKLFWGNFNLLPFKVTVQWIILTLLYAALSTTSNINSIFFVACCLISQHVPLSLSGHDDFALIE